MKHEDNRRIIYDWSNGNWKSLKVVYVKDEIAIGDHFHSEKEECFFLAVGEFLELQLGDDIKKNILAPYYFTVEKNQYHKFICRSGSIIFGGASELFNPNDEINGVPKT